MRWQQGREALDGMITRGELERVPASRQQADLLLAQANQHTKSAQAVMTFDAAGAYQLLYDAARKALAAVLDEARVSAGLSKAELARAIEAEPATIRRLFSNKPANPTLGTIAEVTAALGLRIAIEPMPTAELKRLSSQFQSPRTGQKYAKDTTRATHTRRRVVAQPHCSDNRP